METYNEPMEHSSCIPPQLIIDGNVQPGCMLSCGAGPEDDRTITFDEFFEVMVKKITEERRFSDNIIFESSTFLLLG